MKTQSTGKIRPKLTLSVPTAADLASRCKRLAEKSDELSRFAEDLKTDHPAIRGLRSILAGLRKACVQLDAAHLQAQGLWDSACGAADQGWRDHE